MKHIATMLSQKGTFDKDIEKIVLPLQDLKDLIFLSMQSMISIKCIVSYFYFLISN